MAAVDTSTLVERGYLPDSFDPQLLQVPAVPSRVSEHHPKLPKSVDEVVSYLSISNVPPSSIIDVCTYWILDVDANARIKTMREWLSVASSSHRHFSFNEWNYEYFSSEGPVSYCVFSGLDRHIAISEDGKVYGRFAVREAYETMRPTQVLADTGMDVLALLMISLSLTTASQLEDSIGEVSTSLPLHNLKVSALCSLFFGDSHVQLNTEDSGC
jgi:hypothetical protein